MRSPFNPEDRGEWQENPRSRFGHPGEADAFVSPDDLLRHDRLGTSTTPSLDDRVEAALRRRASRSAKPWWKKLLGL
jgi:hypothetical protein